MREKDVILQAVISLNLKKEQVGKKCDSAFGAVHKCISTIDKETPEREKKEKLIRILQSFWRGKSGRIDGCKRGQLQTIAKLAFGISGEQSIFLRQEIRQYTFQELYLYYCYVEQMAKGDDYFIQYLQKYKNEKQHKLKEQKEKEEQEKQKALEEKQREIDEMRGIDRWKYDIIEKHQDIDYFQKLDKDQKFSAEERIAVAQLLMEYWKETKKWEGDKVNKKQMVRIARIQEILADVQQ